MVLTGRLRAAIERLNPGVPLHAREDALKGEGAPPHAAAGHHPVRQGLPLVLLEIKNPADEKASIWKAYDQVQTYKEQIPDIFQANELLVVSDGSEARLGSLSANSERFMQWRTIDGVTLDPLGEFNELETLVRGVLAPAYLLDYLRYFVLFEDDGTLVKKIAGYHQFHAVRSAIRQVVEASRPEGSHKGGVVWQYTASHGRGRPTVDAREALSVLLEKLEVLRTMLHGFDWSGFLAGGHKTLAGAANHVLGAKDGKKRFADTSLAMAKAFTLCCTLDDAKALREEVAFHQRSACS